MYFVISGFFIPGFHCKGAFINCERGGGGGDLRGRPENFLHRKGGT